jgi:hypothetical protein
MMAAHHVLNLSPCYASHVRKSPLCNESPGDLRGTISLVFTSMSGGRTPISMRTDHIPHCPCSARYVIRSGYRIVQVLKEFVAEAGAIKGKDLRFGVRKIRSWASRDRHRDVVWLYAAVPHEHLIVVITVM